MIEAGLCTDDQYEYGKDALLSHLTRYHDSKSANSNAAYSPTCNNRKVASKSSDDENDEALLVCDSVKKARDELDQYLQWNKSRFYQR